jgi:hypothetical protein
MQSLPRLPPRNEKLIDEKCIQYATETQPTTHSMCPYLTITSLCSFPEIRGVLYSIYISIRSYIYSYWVKCD